MGFFAFRRFAWIAIALLAFAPLALPPAHAQGTLDRILRDKEMKIGYIPSPPSMIKDPKTGELSGFYWDAMTYITGQIGVKPTFVETTWANFAAGLNSGQFDLCVAGTFATVLRAGAVDFTMPLFYLGYSAIVKKGDTRFKTPADFNNADVKIALIQGGASIDYAKENWPKAQLTLLATGNLTAPYVEVTAGRADVGVEDAWQAHRYALEHPEVTDLFAAEPYNVLPIAWTVKHGNQDLLNFMNSSISYLLTTGRWSKMSEKYGPTGRFYVKPTLATFGVTK